MTATTGAILQFDNELEASVDLIGKVSALLASHPAGQNFRLVLAPGDMDVQADEVLVRTVADDRRSATLSPKRLLELCDGDVLEDSLNVGSDPAYLTYLQDIKAASCLTRTNVRGQKVHIYD